MFSVTTGVPRDLWMKTQCVLSAADRTIYRTARPTMVAFEGAPENPFVNEDANEVQLVNEQVELLKRLYVTFPPDVQAVFTMTILAQLTTANAQVVAQTIIELHELHHVTEWDRIDEVGQHFVQGITLKLRWEHWKFTEDDISECIRIVSAVRSHAVKEMNEHARAMSSEYVTGRSALHYVNKFLGVHQRVRYVRLKNELRALPNPAIDADRQVLRSRIEALGFSKKLSDALNETERRGATAATGLDFKTAMDLLRTFFEEFIEEASQKIAPKTGQPAPTGPSISHFGSFKDYLRSVNIIGPEEEQVLQKLYNYLSNRGSHSLGSAPEQFHVAQATVIEWCMMIAGRVTAFMA
jgi:hypothetical protein